MSAEKFLQFMKEVNAGQPAHRDDLGDEASSEKSVMGGMSAASLQLAPQLQKQMALEMAPTAAPRAVPKAAPPSMGMGMGGGGGGMLRGGGGVSRPPSKPTKRDEE